MTTLSFLKMYAVGVVACFALDLVWLGLLAKSFYHFPLRAALTDLVGARSCPPR